ncbi:MAG: hypothetical protein CUN52_11310 [Phototrophicales bacterium]|nr:MAG: hypothetical protein CUN52_11310 [Phototrophicales bacterium]
MSNADRTRKLLIRSMVITTSTVATILGAQNLALLDAQSFQSMNTPVAIPLETTTAPTLTDMGDVQSPIIRQSTPHIVILRNAGSTSADATSTRGQQPSSSVIMPPVPSQVIEQQPIIYQQPVPQVSRSSR